MGLDVVDLGSSNLTAGSSWLPVSSKDTWGSLGVPGEGFPSKDCVSWDGLTLWNWSADVLDKLSAVSGDDLSVLSSDGWATCTLVW